jgi:3'-phosphoadenosine 5'-phosphosulfate sulfotransferase (PAPS reductase)/FAD synthetase
MASSNDQSPLHVVALSGGKDSTAMALRLQEVEPRDYMYVCTPTGNELPEMFEHWRRLGELLGKPIVPVIGGTLEGIIRQEGMIPNFRARFCTRMLKIAPFAGWLMRQERPVISYIGLRADESAREAGDYTNVPGVVMRFPMREWGWTIKNVLQYLDARGVGIPLRTDCAWCFFQTLGEWFNLWRYHILIYLQAEAIEDEMGHTFRSPGRDTWPAKLSELRKRFERGDIPRGADLQADMFSLTKCRVCRA